jgi:hypothetical protein
MQLYGQTWTRREIEARVGRLEQIGGIRRLHWAEGVETDVEQIQVRTGAGLSYYVSPSRALDISLVEFGSVPISWQSPNGDVHPAYFDDGGVQWLRTAVGGLLMTCGLSNVGSPGVENGQEFGLHGRVHHIPARQVCSSGRWIGDDYMMEVEGIIEESAIFGEYLRLQRSIRSQLGQNRIELTDLVENVGFEPTPLMILYHFNFGFPLLAEETTIRFPSSQVEARDSGTPLDGYDRWHSPEVGFQEQVYYHHDFDSDFVSAKVHNPKFPIAGGVSTKPLTVHLDWSVGQLPKLVQWKMPGAGIHVLGIEPANCYVEGRAAEREKGTLDSLQPGESRTYQLSIEVTIDG